MNSNKPIIVNESAVRNFRELATHFNLDPNNQWVGGYVDYEWAHVRHIFESYENDYVGVSILEIGCNFGASAIVLACLGAKVAAIDISEKFIEIAKVNSAIYGLEGNINFSHITDSTKLPFSNGQFDIINCNSVLEYIPISIRKKVLMELDRVLAPNGLIFISGTSNRLWPVETHSRKWFVNYIPYPIDRFILREHPFERGIFPWEINQVFGKYQNIDVIGCGYQYLQAKRQMGVSSSKLKILWGLNFVARACGIWVGYMTPSLAVTLRKPKI